jgi:glycogen debranching enzyme
VVSEIIMKKCYLLGGKDAFLFRFNDTAFGSKWSGLWFPQKKVMDYYAYQINDQWLGTENCVSFKRSAGIAKHDFKVKGLAVSETTCVPIQGRGLISNLSIRNRGKRSVDLNIALKPGVNIRHIWENGHSRKYMAKGKSIVKIKSDLMELFIYGKSGVFHNEPTYKTHRPGYYINEWGWKDEFEQTVYEPGLLDVSVQIPGNKRVEVPFLFSHGDDFNTIKNWEKLVEQSKEKESELMKLYSIEKAGMAACSLAGLRTRGGYMAGLPWFQNMWGRDSAWMTMGAVNLGDFESVRDSLVKLASHERSGQIPNRTNGKVEYGSADASPLFIVALERYVRYSKDFELFDQLRPAIERILEYGASLMENNLVRREGHTWMDTLERGDHCIELQSVWAEAFLRASQFFKPRYERFHNQLIHSINNEFWNGKFFEDELHIDRLTSNVLFPLFFKQIEYKKALKAFHLLESTEFTTPVGIRTVSNEDVDYDADGYHTGCVWGLLTGMMSYAEYNYGRDVIGKKYLDMMLNNISKRCEWSIDEIYNGDTLQPMGCISQGWSLSPLFMVLDEMVLGVKPEVGHYVMVKPTESVSRRSIRVGDDNFSIVPKGKNYIISGLKQNSLKKGRATVKLR